MAFDYKKDKQYKDLNNPKINPSIITVPKANYIAVRGKGNPNIPDGEYVKSIGLLYGLAYTIKMSYKGEHQIKGYYEYVVPPLEGFWWEEGIDGMDYTKKEKFHFISIMRIPEFVTKEEFEWAKNEAQRKKNTDFSKVEFLEYDEGLCVQSLHYGPFDDEPKTVEKMHELVEKEGYVLDISDSRYHHEIYLSDPRKGDPSKQKTIIRHPIKAIVNENK